MLDKPDKMFQLHLFITLVAFKLVTLDDHRVLNINKDKKSIEVTFNKSNSD